MTTEERLNRLERKNRRLTLALVLTGLAAGLVATAGMGPADAVPNEVKARQFTLVDADGKLRARLGPSSEGASFILCDASGKARAGFGMTKQGPELLLTNENGKPQLKLAAEGAPLFQLFDDGGKLRADLVVTKGGAGEGPALQLFDTYGRARAALMVSKAGPAFLLLDRSGQVLRSLP
jgi:hypothetical protein